MQRIRILTAVAALGLTAGCQSRDVAIPRTAQEQEPATVQEPGVGGSGEEIGGASNEAGGAVDRPIEFKAKRDPFQPPADLQRGVGGAGQEGLNAPLEAPAEAPGEPDPAKGAGE